MRNKKFVTKVQVNNADKNDKDIFIESVEQLEIIERVMTGK